ncbi:hypothetical protein EJB05_29392 [Eragrostis curvula]|uniref:Uncharacterized protein n=1 Tax=Eragrostis curvula TaxID=38414 RepID=A0A5J9UUP7_9POAL|nr:hypothetical protein EJB05_29392 [Eragrostis curvula]
MSLGSLCTSRGSLPHRSRAKVQTEQGAATLHLDMAVCGRLEPEPAGPYDAVATTGDEEGWASDEDVVVSGGPASDLPPDAAVDLDLHDQVPVGDVLAERVGEVRGERYVGPGEHRRQRRAQRHLLALVRRVHVEAVVVHADAAVRVAGGDGHLQRRGEDAGDVGEVQLLERGVLEFRCRTQRRGAERRLALFRRLPHKLLGIRGVAPRGLHLRILLPQSPRRACSSPGWR